MFRYRCFCVLAVSDTWHLCLSKNVMNMKELCLWNIFIGTIIVVTSLFRRVNEAAKRQMDKLWHTTSIYLYPSVHEYVSKLAEKMPGDLKVKEKENQISFDVYISWYVQKKRKTIQSRVRRIYVASHFGFWKILCVNFGEILGKQLMVLQLFEKLLYFIRNTRFVPYCWYVFYLYLLTKGYRFDWFTSSFYCVGGSIP